MLFFIGMLPLAVTAVRANPQQQSPVPAPYMVGKPSRTVDAWLLSHSQKAIELVQLHGGRLSKDLPKNAAVPLEPGLFFHKGGEPWFISLRQIERLRFNPCGERTIYSDEETRCINLGGGEEMMPEPPGWESDVRDNPLWQRAHEASPNYQWICLPGAKWIWSHDDDVDAQEPADEAALFRRVFRTYPAEERLLRATLEATCDAGLDAVYLNGQPILRERRPLTGEAVRWDVTGMLRSGENLLAIRAYNTPAEDLDATGLAFRLKIEYIEQPQGEEPLPPRHGVVARMLNGDLIKAQQLRIREDEVLLRGAGADWTFNCDFVEWAECFYTDDSTVWSGRFSRIINGVKDWVADSSGNALRTMQAVELTPLQGVSAHGVIPLDGQFSEGETLESGHNGLRVQPKFGRVSTLPFSALKRIYLNAHPDNDSYYLMDNNPLLCRLTLINGSSVTGQLEMLNPNKTALTPQSGATCYFDTGQVQEIVFLRQPDIYFSGAIEHFWPRTKPKTIALIGERKKGELLAGVQPIIVLQKIAAEYGFEIQWLSPADLVNDAQFNVDKFSILVNLDENGSLYRTFYIENDVTESLKLFIDNGGCFIQCGLGMPFKYAFSRKSGVWARELDENRFNVQLETSIVDIAARQPGVIPFDLPPKPENMLTFVKICDDSWAQLLPGRIPFDVLKDARFRPIVAPDDLEEPERFTPVYRLIDAQGRDYGVAMALIRGKNGSGDRAYIASPLARSMARSEPSMKFLIPAVILAAVQND